MEMLTTIKFLRKFTKNKIIVIIARTELEIPADHVIRVDVPEQFSNLQGSRYLKTSIHRLIKPLEGKYCYLDNDVYAVHKSAADIFKYKKGLITFAPDHLATIEIFSKDALRVGQLTEEIARKFAVQVERTWRLWNGGVFLFDKASFKFLDTWHQFTMSIMHDYRWQTRDQGTLIATIWKYGIQDQATIPEEFNWIARHSKSPGYTLRFKHNEFVHNKKAIKFIHFIHEVKQEGISSEFENAFLLL
jgi:hypothetical protein